eukprot:4632718-Pyramimonas_sp.AAC.1
MDAYAASNVLVRVSAASSTTAAVLVAIFPVPLLHVGVIFVLLLRSSHSPSVRRLVATLHVVPERRT